MYEIFVALMVYFESFDEKLSGPQFVMRLSLRNYGITSFTVNRTVICKFMHAILRFLLKIKVCETLLNV